MKVHAEARPLQEPLQGGSVNATVMVEPLIAGEFQSPPAAQEYGGQRLWKLSAFGRRRNWTWVPVPAFFIRHPGAGALLVDTGLHASISSDPKQNFGRAAAWAVRPQLAPGEDVPAQLRSRGIDPREVRVVILTHLHVDHASAVSEFPNATFIVSAFEWEAATTDRNPTLRAYRPAQFDYVFDYRTVDFAGAGVNSYATFGRTFDLFGDGSIRLAYTPGHSAGHMSVVCHLRDRDFVIAGDAVYTERQLTGKTEPAEPADRHNWRRSRQELQLFAREFPEAIIVPGHDPSFWSKLEGRYE